MANITFSQTQDLQRAALKVVSALTDADIVTATIKFMELWNAIQHDLVDKRTDSPD